MVRGGPSSAIKWVAAYRTTGSLCGQAAGGSTSPLEKYANFLLTLIEGQPDLTLDEVVCADAQAQGSLAVAPRRGASFSATRSRLKKSLSAAEQQRADVARARRRWMREQGMLTRPGWCSSMRVCCRAAEGVQHELKPFREAG